MKKIPEIKYLKSARNAEHYHLQERLIAIITTAFADKYKISGYRENYGNLFMKEDELFLQSAGYADTKTIEEKDAYRDQRFRYIDLQIQSGLISLVAAQAEAAKTLDYVMNPYRGACSKPFAENTAMVNDMVKKLQSDEYAPVVTALGLTAAVADLKTANEDFEKVYSHRADEKLVRETGDKLKAIRPQVDEAFRLLSEAINALCLVAETIEHDAAKVAELGAVVDAVNAQILQFSQTLARRGVGTKTKLDPETPPDLNPGGGDDERPGDL